MRLVEYIEKNSFIHKLDARTKIFVSLTLMVLALLFNDPFVLAAVFAVVIILSFLSKINTEFLDKIKILSPIVVMAFLMWTAFYRQSLFASRVEVEEYFNFWFLKIDRLSVTYGVAMMFRVLTLMGAPLLLFMTTSFNDLVLSMVKLGMPYKWAFTVGLILRFVKSIQTEAEAIRDAQVSRGLELTKGSIIRRTINMVPIVKPLMYKSMGMEDQLSISMDTKAFGVHKNRTYYKDLRMKRRDIMIIFLSASLLLASVFLRINSFGVIG